MQATPLTPPSPPPDLPRNLGALEASDWQSRSVRDEVRANLVRLLAQDAPLFAGIIGYDRTVIPQIVNALLSRHDLILLGLRGQAKSRLARGLLDLLDEWLPIIDGSPLPDDPTAPISTVGRRLREERGADLPIRWLHRSERFQEKLATPDITMADLIGDLDPIKAAAEKRTLMDPEIIHFGLIPRTHRGIFCINELPDLPTRLQVGLFNLLEEKDVQIRGFPLRMPLDLLLVFTANPEDYTNRGNIITPLRDRIRSQIHTHYPLSLDDGLSITEQEAWQDRNGEVRVQVSRYLREAIEETAIQARTSSFVDQASGVSARVTVALRENLISNAERRALQGHETEVWARPSDLFAALPGLAGKIELVFEGEQEGPLSVCRHLLGKGLKAVFDRHLADPYREGQAEQEYAEILAHFKAGNVVRTSEDATDTATFAELEKVPGLVELARTRLEANQPGELAAAMEFILEGLHQASLLARTERIDGVEYRDQFDQMMQGLQE